MHTCYIEKEDIMLVITLLKILSFGLFAVALFTGVLLIKKIYPLVWHFASGGLIKAKFPMNRRGLPFEALTLVICGWTIMGILLFAEHGPWMPAQWTFVLLLSLACVMFNAGNLIRFSSYRRTVLN